MLQFHPDQKLEEARLRAERSLHFAKARLAQAELRIKLGRRPRTDEILAWVRKEPFYVSEINREASTYRQARKAKWLSGEPLGPEEGTYR